MVTKPIACAMWTKFAAAPAAWWASQQSRTLVEKALALVREREGNDEANALENLLLTAEATAVLME